MPISESPKNQPSISNISGKNGIDAFMHVKKKYRFFGKRTGVTYPMNSSKLTEKKINASVMLKVFPMGENKVKVKVPEDQLELLKSKKIDQLVFVDDHGKKIVFKKNNIIFEKLDANELQNLTALVDAMKFAHGLDNTERKSGSKEEEGKHGAIASSTPTEVKRRSSLELSTYTNKVGNGEQFSRKKEEKQMIQSARAEERTRRELSEQKDEEAQERIEEDVEKSTKKRDILSNDLEK